MIEFRKRYEESWDQFANQISTLSQDLINMASSDEGKDLQEILSSLQVVPYNKAPKLFHNLLESFGTAGTKTNVGSVTGLFFEIIVASLVTGYVRKYLPDAKIMLNSCSSENSLLQFCRDPDIFIVHQGKYVIFEIKVSPKKGDLERAKFLQGQYNSLLQKNASYFLIGGHVTASAESLKLLEGWACFTSSSGANTPLLESFKLDTLLAKAVLVLK